MYFLFFITAIILFNIVVGVGIWSFLFDTYIRLLSAIFEYTYWTLSESKLTTKGKAPLAKRSKLERQNAFDTLHGNCLPENSQNQILDMAIENHENQQQQSQQQQQLQQDPRHYDNNDEKLLKKPDISIYSKTMADVCKLIVEGFQVILKDEVTKCFVSEKPRYWNLLTRHLVNYHQLTWQLKALWILGILLRYIIFLPVRFILCCTSVVCIAVLSVILGQLPDSKWKKQMINTVMKFCFRFMACSVSAGIRFHNPENRPKNGICVANHTTPMDVLMLMCDTNFSLIGQGHRGFLGLIQMLLNCVSLNMWFERAEAHDRHEVSAMMRNHIAVPDNPPVLIFPEGTCVNNTCVIKFKKGCFEISDVIAPVAIKYDRRFGEPFWDSSRYSFLHYIYRMISSWSIVCDVWYLPHMRRHSDETSIQFANRVKAVIAHKANLANLDWDGNLKRYNPPWKNDHH